MQDKKIKEVAKHVVDGFKKFTKDRPLTDGERVYSINAGEEVAKVFNETIDALKNKDKKLLQTKTKEFFELCKLHNFGEKEDLAAMMVFLLTSDYEENKEYVFEPLGIPKKDKIELPEEYFGFVLDKWGSNIDEHTTYLYELGRIWMRAKALVEAAKKGYDEIWVRANFHAMCIEIEEKPAGEILFHMKRIVYWAYKKLKNVYKNNPEVLNILKRYFDRSLSEPPEV